MTDIKCNVCSTLIVKRSGKFGDFLACPKSNKTDNHGTISLPLTSFKPSIGIKINSCNIDLDKEIDLCCAREFGFIADPLDVFMDVDFGDGKHWSDHRPY